MYDNRLDCRIHKEWLQISNAKSSQFYKWAKEINRTFIKGEQ